MRRLLRLLRLRSRQVFVGVFLALFAVVGFVGPNLWPLTTWRLFSTVRGPSQAGWFVAVVAPSGDEAGLPYDRLPRGYRSTLHVLSGFTAMSAGERDRLCRTWLSAARGVGVEAAAVRVYRTRSSVSLESPPTTVVAREQVHQC